jgi:integrase/recombinase XerD
MTDEAISPLRRRMIEDMTIRKLAPKTQQGYIRTIKDFAAFLGRSPDTASFEDVRRFQLHLAASGAHIPILNHTVAALRFFFRVTLRRSDIIEHTTFVHEPRKLPACSVGRRWRDCWMQRRGSSTRLRWVWLMARVCAPPR